MRNLFRSCLATVATFALGAGFVGVSSGPAAACDPDAYLGTICTFAFNYCPQNMLPANGAILGISQNQALFALLGTTYGGNGTTTFNLPDLRARSIVGAGQGPGLSNISLGQPVGQQSTLLTTAQTPLPPHTHPAALALTTTQQTVNVPAGAGNLGVTASLSARQVGGVTVPDNGFLLGQGGIGAGAATIYVNPTVTGTNVSLGGLNVALTGTAGNGAFSFTVPTASGGTVTVNPNTPTPASQPVSTQSPGLGLTTCIVTSGIWPPRS